MPHCNVAQYEEQIHILPKNTHENVSREIKSTHLLTHHQHQLHHHLCLQPDRNNTAINHTRQFCIF